MHYKLYFEGKKCMILFMGNECKWVYITMSLINGQQFYFVGLQILSCPNSYSRGRSVTNSWLVLYVII